MRALAHTFFRRSARTICCYHHHHRRPIFMLDRGGMDVPGRERTFTADQPKYRTKYEVNKTLINVRHSNDQTRINVCECK